MFSLIITGIASAADVQSVGRMGVRTLVVFILLLVGMALVIMPLAPSVFALLPDGARPTLPPGAAEAAHELASGGQVQSFASWVGSLLPANPIGAAANGDMVPFILFVLLLALAIARSSDATRTTVVAFFRAVGEAMMTLVRGVIWLAPLGVFVLVLFVRSPRTRVARSSGRSGSTSSPIPPPRSSASRSCIRSWVSRPAFRWRDSPKAVLPRSSLRSARVPPLRHCRRWSRRPRRTLRCRST